MWKYIWLFLIASSLFAQEPKAIVWLDLNGQPWLVIPGLNTSNSVDTGVWLECGVGLKDSHRVSYTPTGIYTVIYKKENPYFIDVHGKLIAGPYIKDKNNVYGTRIIGLNYIRHGRHLCIHGTNEPELLPGYVSHMCIRLRNQDVEWLYDYINIGDTIEVEE